MANDNDRQRISDLLRKDDSLTNKLNGDEAKALVDWAMTELDGPNGRDDSHVKRLHDAMAEINVLVGDRQALVSDDLEERMAALLVGDLDPKSLVRLEREREIAQVTAEKDHIEGVDLVRRFTEIASRAWRARDNAPAVGPLGVAATPSTASSIPSDSSPSLAPAARVRPIPRPSKIEPFKPGFLDRLLGRK